MTGACGFIGSHLSERLVREGHRVLGVDCFTEYYDPAIKKENVAGAMAHPLFELSTADLRTDDLAELLGRADVVFHLAGQPGIRLSWSDGFGEYVSCNIVATQRLLEAAKESGLRRLVFSSSSSVYGEVDSYPTSEDVSPRPFSPYGVTKLAAEGLCAAYAANYDLSVVSLRYFSVYGPRQRPDMATQRIIAAARAGRTFPVYGSGDQLRDFTYVDDVVAANLAAAAVDVAPKGPLNICGGSQASLNDVIRTVAEQMGRPLDVEFHDVQRGDVQRTHGTHARATALIGWEPVTSLSDGIAAQISWNRRSVVG